MPTRDVPMSSEFLLTCRLCSKGERPRKRGSQTESRLLLQVKIILISDITQPPFVTICLSRRSALPLPISREGQTGPAFCWDWTCFHDCFWKTHFLLQLSQLHPIIVEEARQATGSQVQSSFKWQRDPLVQ